MSIDENARFVNCGKFYSKETAKKLFEEIEKGGLVECYINSVNKITIENTGKAFERAVKEKFDGKVRIIKREDKPMPIWYFELKA